MPVQEAVGEERAQLRRAVPVVQRAGAVHLLTNDARDPGEAAPAKRQVVVDAGR